jgi:hypothetical protein
MTGYANPSAVIDAEIALGRLAREKGQWTAFRDTAARDAILFAPDRVGAAAWLKGKPNPPVAMTWQVHEVWMSCDGSYAVARGAWQQPGTGQSGSGGVYATIWQRQPGRGGYKWVLGLREATATPPEAPDMIPAHVADCSNRPRRPAQGGKPSSPPKELATIDPADAQSNDGTLRWVATLDGKGAGSFVVSRWNGSGYVEAERILLSARD